MTSLPKNINRDLVNRIYIMLRRHYWPLSDIVIFIYKKIIKKINGKKLAILGMDQSGKTHYFHFLQGKEYEKGPQTKISKIESFYYKKKDGTSIRIAEGYDIGGSKLFIKDHYEQLMKDSDCVIFMFDISKYDKEYEYMKEVHARFEFLSRMKNTLGIDDNNFKLFATHADLLSKNELKSVYDTLNRNLENKEYKDILKCDLFPINMTKKEKLKEITDLLL